MITVELQACVNGSSPAASQAWAIPGMDKAAANVVHIASGHCLTGAADGSVGQTSHAL